jgi:hypothetical protein
VRRRAVPAETSRRYFGKPLDLKILCVGLKVLHDRLLPKSVYDFSDIQEVRFEELLHEIGHHVSLDSRQWNTPRMEPVGTTLSAMSMSTREGNEIDALAISIMISEFLGRPLSIRYVDAAVRNNNLKCTSITQARRMVNHVLSEDRDMYTLGYSVAHEVYAILHAKDLLR